MDTTNGTSKLMVVKNLYLYLVSFAALMMVAISAITLIGNILKLTVFPQADSWYSESYRAPGCGGYPAAPGQPTMTEEQCKQEEERFKNDQEVARQHRLQNSFIWSISVLIVGLPLFFFHWRMIKRKENAV